MRNIPPFSHPDPPDRFHLRSVTPKTGPRRIRPYSPAFLLFPTPFIVGVRRGELSRDNLCRGDGCEEVTEAGGGGGGGGRRVDWGGEGGSGEGSVLSHFHFPSTSLLPLITYQAHRSSLTSLPT